MEISNSRINAGKASDWGRTAPERFEVLHYAALALVARKQ